MEIERGAAQFDLSVSVDLSMKRTVSFEYSTDLFHGDRIDRMAAHLWTFLEAVIADPSLPIAQVPILPATERLALERMSPGPAMPVDHVSTMHGLVEQQAARTPDRVALRFDGQVVTYEQLNARANQLAHHLMALGVVRGDVVGVHLYRSVDMVVSVLAVLKTGAAYVPLDPSYPEQRLAYMQSDTGAPVVVSCSDVVQLEGVSAQRLLLDERWDDIAEAPAEDPGVQLTGTDLAYVIYTSGSTGRPKGVLVEHRNAVSFLRAFGLDVRVGPEDVVLGATTLSFDPSVVEIFLPLMHGAQIVIADRETTLDPARLSELVRASGVTLMQATPITWRMLIDFGWTGEPGLTALYGGEAMAPQLVAQLCRTCRAVWNIYGPTETTVWATVQHVDPDRNLSSGAVPIGRPVANARCYVLDASLQPVPIGVPGELYIGGEGVTRGYLNQPELTAERFVADPFAGSSAGSHVPDGGCVPPVGRREPGAPGSG